MKTVYFQLLAVLFLFIISVFLCFYLRKENGEERTGKKHLDNPLPTYSTGFWIRIAPGALIPQTDG